MHAFGDQVFGIWSLIAAFMGYYGLLDLGLSSAISRFVSRAIGQKNEEQINEIVTTGFYVLLLISFISILATFGLMFLSKFLFKQAVEVTLFNQLLAILSVNIALGFPCYVFEGVLTSHLRFDLLTTVRLLNTVIRTVMTYVLIQWHYDIAMIAFLTVALNILENVIKVFMAYAVNPALRISPAYYRAHQIKEMCSYSVYTFVAKVADLLRFQIVAVVLTAFINVAAVTHYRVAARLIEYFMQLIVGVTSVFTPYFSQKEGAKNLSEIREKFLLVSKINVYIALFIGCALIFYGKDFIIRWVGVEYIGSYQVLVVLTIPITIALTQTTTYSLLYGISKHKFLSYTNIGEGVANLILSLLLVKPFGMIGVAWAMGIPLFISKIFIQPWYTSRVLGMPFLEYSWTLLRPSIFGLGAFLLPGAFFYSFLRPDFGNLLIFSLFHLVIYSLVVFFWGVVPEERLKLVNLIRNKRS